MRLETYRFILHNRNRFDNATTGGTDKSTDANIVRNPNNYLAPYVGKGALQNILVTLVLVLLIALLLKNIWK